MDKYQLSFYEKLIRHHIQQKAAAQPQPDQTYYITTVSKIQEEKERILDAFCNDVFYMSDEKEIEWRVQLHQKKIILLLEKVAGQLTRNDILDLKAFSDNPSWANLYKIIYATLLELLTHIETEYAKYLDQHLPVPLSYQFTCIRKFAGIIPVISAQFTAVGINAPLLEIILEPFKQVQSEDESAYPSYHKLYYLNTLLERLLQLASPGTVTNNIHQEVQQLLLELNFNSDRYYTYCTNLVKSEIAALPIKEQLEQLNWMQKQVNQVPPKAGFIYNPRHTGLHQLLQVWFIEEIAYLDRILFLSNPHHSIEELHRWKNFKILTQLSVAQLGHLLKLFTDTGILLNQNKTELLEFYACFVACTKQENISHGSLRKNFYAEDAAVSDSVRSILIRLLNQSRKGLPLLLAFLVIA